MGGRLTGDWAVMERWLGIGCLAGSSTIAVAGHGAVQPSRFGPPGGARPGLFVAGLPSLSLAAPVRLCHRRSFPRIYSRLVFFRRTSAPGLSVRSGPGVVAQPASISGGWPQ